MVSVGKSLSFRTSVLLVLVSTIMGTILVIVATSSYGAGLSPDSVGYISIARQLAEGNGYIDRYGQDVAIWPPLYPAVLSVPQLFVSVDPLKSTRFINALAFGLNVALTLWIVAQSFPRKIAFVTLPWLLFSLPLLSVSEMAWSEPLFILFSIGWLISLNTYFSRTRKRTAALLLAALFASLATLTRYIGVTLIASSVLVILVVSKTFLRARVSDAIGFSVLSATPLTLWLIRNRVLTGTFMGERAPSRYSLYDNLYFTRNTLFGWILPERLEPYYSELSLILIVAAIVIALYIVRNKLYVNANVPMFFLLSVFLVIYLGFLIISSTTTAYDRIGDRLMAPVYPVLVLIVLFVLQMLLKGLPHLAARRLGQYFVVFTIGAWAVLPIYRTIRHIEYGLENGYGYAAKSWQNSETIAELGRTTVCNNRPIYSNRSDALYILAKIYAHSTPRRTFYNSEEQADNLENVRWPETSPACLVWFQETRSYLFTPEELSSIADVSLLTKLDDGAIYSVSSPSDEES